MKSADEWLACRPLAEANQRAWVEAIRAEALRFAAANISAPWDQIDKLQTMADRLDPPKEKKT